MQEYVQKAGFVDILVKEYRLPVGTWSSGKPISERAEIDPSSKLAGKYAVGAFTKFIDSMAPMYEKLTPTLSQQEQEDFLGKVRENFLDTDLHLYSIL